MEVTSTYPKPQASIKRTASDEHKASASKGAAGPEASAPEAIRADKQSPVATDTVSLSSESLNLAKSAENQTSNDGASISNKQQAEKAVEKLVSGIRNNAQLALAAYSNTNESADRLKALLN